MEGPTASTVFTNMMTFEHLEKPVQKHLKKVYTTLSIALVLAAAGAYVHLFTNILQAGFLSFIGSIGLLILLSCTSHTQANESKRFGYLMGFSFFSGLALGPLLDMVMSIDETIIPTALMGTSIVFICFTLSALLNTSKQWIYLGGILLSAMSWMLLLSVVNIFFRNPLLYNINLYGGLLIVLGFILYDTQMIVEKRRRGDDDYIWHSVDLFIDFMNLFRRILIILANNSDNKKKNERRR